MAGTVLAAIVAMRIAGRRDARLSPVLAME
jgi:hypothetical protein